MNPLEDLIWNSKNITRKNSKTHDFGSRILSNEQNKLTCGFHLSKLEVEKINKQDPHFPVHWCYYPVSSFHLPYPLSNQVQWHQLQLPSFALVVRHYHLYTIPAESEGMLSSQCSLSEDWTDMISGQEYKYYHAFHQVKPVRFSLHTRQSHKHPKTRFRK